MPADTISLEDGDLPSGSSFCYRARASNEAGFSGYSNEVCGTIVWPSLETIEPAEAVPGEEVEVIGHGGYVRIGTSGYDESSRSFALYFDGSSVGGVGCYVVSCRGGFTVPRDASLGDHQLCVQGGSCYTFRVVQAVATPTPTPPTATPTAIVTAETSGLTFTITIDPLEPKVGDAVRVAASASGEGGIPQYILRLASEGEPPLRLESPLSVTTNQLGREVAWDLTAVRPGVAMLYVSVNYEREFRAPHGTFWAFTNDASDPVMVTVVEAPTPTPTPTVTITGVGARCS